VIHKKMGQHTTEMEAQRAVIGSLATQLNKKRVSSRTQAASMSSLTMRAIERLMTGVIDRHCELDPICRELTIEAAQGRQPSMRGALQ
jgi:hypothetical protein